MPSFDIVSRVDRQEVDNAVNQARKEIQQRYDFKGTHNEINLEESGILLLGHDDYKLQAMVDILKGKLVRRGVSPRSLKFGNPEKASGTAVRQKAELIQGISKEKGKEIVKAIKGLKLKVQPQITDEEVRVSGKKLDDLQTVIAHLKQLDLELDLQFVNMRS